MKPEEELAFIHEVLTLCAEHDVREDLLWQVKPEGVSFYIMCNDVFAPAADAEELLPEDVPLFRQALDDATAIDEEMWGPLLYVGRRRKIRPWGRWWREDGTLSKKPELARLLKACGPNPWGKSND